MIVYRFKVTFEDVDEVERTIDIRANQTFTDMYRAIVESIGFDPNITASFYISGDNWRKGREITNAHKDDTLMMSDCKLNSFVNDPHQKMLLVTHDEMEWTLRVQLFKIQKAEETVAYPVCVKSVGTAPKQSKIISIGLATNEFEEMVDEIVREEEEHDISEMGFDDESGLETAADDEVVEIDEDSDDEEAEEEAEGFYSEDED